MTRKTCNEYIVVGGVPVCKLECVPCPVVYESGECAEDKINKFVEKMSKYTKGDE